MNSEINLYFDFEGNPISVKDWMNLKDSSGWRVGLARRENNGVEYIVSTFWNGYDCKDRKGEPYSTHMGAPLIYETVVYASDKEDRWSDYSQVYYTRDQAKHGHERILLLVDSE